MIDLHCHLLPGVDDGAQTIDDSLALAKKAVSQGISHILCTPHHNNHRYDNPSAKVISAVAELQAVLDQENIPLTVYEGQEVHLTGELLEDFDAGNLLCTDLSNRYLLVEFPSQDVPAYTEMVFLGLLTRKVTPIIVHPERNRVFMEEPNKLLPFLEMGCLTQLTAPSYVGVFGKKIQKVAKQMVKHNLVQMVASDAHNLKTRTFYLKEAYEQIEKDFGKEKLEALKKVTRHVINGDEAVVAEPREVKKSFLGL